jgi:hypothetical protein
MFDSATEYNWISKTVADRLKLVIVNMPSEQYTTFSGVTFQSSEVADIVWSAGVGEGAHGSRQSRFRISNSPMDVDIVFGKDFIDLIFSEPNVASMFLNSELVGDKEASKSSPQDLTDLTNYEDYLRRNLPQFVRSALEARINNEIQPIEEGLRDQILDVIEEAQNQAFLAYRAQAEAKDNPPPLT